MLTGLLVPAIASWHLGSAGIWEAWAHSADRDDAIGNSTEPDFFVVEFSGIIPAVRLKLEDELLQRAWIGDAVLHLFAREWALSQPGTPDAEQVARFVSNQFLSNFGSADRIEAEIGRRYREGGLEEAFSYIRTDLLPVFLRQEANRKSRLPAKSR